VAVLNADLYVDDDWLVHILKAFEKYPIIGAVQPLVYWYQYPDRVQSKGLYADLIGNYKDNVFGAKAILAPFGAAYVVRRDAFIRVGGLDPYYFMYGDELDLGLRMWLAGWMVVLEPTSKVYHYMGGSTPSLDKFYILKRFLARRNQMITLLKDFFFKASLFIIPASFTCECCSGS
jgi:GT2 family glycosyltransferase